MRKENRDIDRQKSRQTGHALRAIYKDSNGAFERYTWFFGLYLVSVFVLTSIGTVVRWLLTVF